MVVMPQCPRESFWVARIESILAFIQQLTETFPIDETKVFLTGLSMGGFGTWYTAQAKPDLFTAIAPVCGGGMSWCASVLNMPIWAFHGTEDKSVSVTQTDEMVQKLEAAGADVRYTRAEGVGHNVWELAYTDELMQWFLRKAE